MRIDLDIRVARCASSASCATLLFAHRHYRQLGTGQHLSSEHIARRIAPYLSRPASASRSSSGDVVAIAAIAAVVAILAEYGATLMKVSSRYTLIAHL